MSKYQVTNSKTVDHLRPGKLQADWTTLYSTNQSRNNTTPVRTVQPVRILAINPFQCMTYDTIKLQP